MGVKSIKNYRKRLIFESFIAMFFTNERENNFIMSLKHKKPKTIKAFFQKKTKRLFMF